MKWKIASGSARGSSHQRTERPNQDACAHGYGEPASHLHAVLAVSDGHGGARHFRSQIGSSLAANTAVAVVQGYAAQHLDADPAQPLDEAAVHLITRKMVEDWRSAVLSDFRNNPFTKEEVAALIAAEGEGAEQAAAADPVVAYGATLLVVAALEGSMLYLQLGDGDILGVMGNGTTARPLPPDERLIGNQTTSLCQPESWKEFRTLVESDAARFPALVLASTDGYSNSFRSEEDFLQIGKDYLGILREDGLDSLAEELPGILAEASQKGSGDDITLGILQGDISPAAAAQAPAEEAPAEPARQQRSPSARRTGSKVGILAMAGAFVACAALFQLSRAYLAGGPRPEAASPKAGIPAVPVAGSTRTKNAPPKGKQWTLDLGSGPAIPLHAGLVIPAGQLLRSAGDQDVASGDPYAEITMDAHGILLITNRSEDTWTVLYKGKKEVEDPITTGGSVVLAEHARITFRNGTAGTIQLGAAQ